MVNKHMRRCSVSLAIRKYNQNHNEKSLQTHQDGYNNNNKWKIISVREDVEQWEALYIVIGNVKWVSCYKKTVWQVPDPNKMKM